MRLRITKYDPTYREENGKYTKDDWTSFSDIGKKIGGKIVTFDDYIKYENAYSGAVMLFFECLNLDHLKITHLEKRGLTKKEILNAGCPEECFDLIENNGYIKKELIPAMVRLILREYFWCKLEAEGMYVHFGYDYYMYIGSSRLCISAIDDIKKSGLFVENYDSPY